MDVMSAKVACQVAGYHEDLAGMTRTLINSRISKKTALDNFYIGRQKKINGLSCSCSRCKQVKQ